MKTVLIVILTLMACVASKAQESFFGAGEVSVDLFGGVRSPDVKSERSLYGFGGQFYVTRNLGIGAYTALENLSGHTFDSINVRGLWRVPIERHAFYAFAGGARTFHGDTGWSIQLGPGYEFRPMKHLGLFTEIGGTWPVEEEARDPEATFRGGIRLSF